MEKRTLQFKKVKETKNTVKFEEIPVEGQPPHIGTLYIQKWYVGAVTNLLVTVEV